MVALLDQTLGEEHAADELLNTISMETVIPAALEAGGGPEEMQEEGEEEEEETATAKASSNKGRRNAVKK